MSLTIRQLSSSLGARLIGLILLVATPGFGLALWADSVQREQAILIAHSEAARVVDRALNEHNETIERARLLLGTIAGGRPSDLPLAECEQVLRDIHSRHTGYTALGVASRDGIVTCNSPAIPAPLDLSDRAHIRRALETRSFAIGDFVIGRSSGLPSVNVTLPLLDSNGEVKSVLVAGIDLGTLNREAAAFNLPEGSSITVIDAAGNILVQSPNAQAWVGRKAPALPSGRPEGHDKPRITQGTWLDTEPRVLASAPIEHGGATIIVGIPEHVALADVEANVRRNLGFIGAFALMSMLLAWIGVRTLVVRPSRELLDTIARLGAGDLQVRARADLAPGEIGQLASAFNRMASELQKRSMERDRMEAERDRFFSMSLDLLCVVDLNGRRRRVNPAFQTLLGWTETEATQSEPFDLFHPDDVLAVKERLATVCNGEVIASFECRVLCRDGGHRWIHWTATPFLDEGVIYASGRDISDRKRYEDELRLLNAALETRVKMEVAQNREKDALLIEQGRSAAMGEMIGNIAHQWRQPINSLALLLDNMRDAHAFGELTPESLDDLVETGNRLIQQMSQTIDDFRDFFRPNREPAEFLLSEVARGALAITEAAYHYDNLRVELRVVRDARARGFANELAQVIMNLLSNAHQAMLERGMARGQVIVTIDADDTEAEITVRDNAGGIPESAIYRLFEPYFTTREAGTGIGLYMSQVIIEQHHQGTITARNVGDGAELRIRMPVVAQMRETVDV